MLRKIIKAQSTLEYALLIALVVAALLTMQNYLKRSIQGRLQASGDQISDTHYSPGLTKRHDEANEKTQLVEEVTSGVGGRTTSRSQGTTSFTSRRELKKLKLEEWPTTSEAQE